MPLPIIVSMHEQPMREGQREVQWAGLPIQQSRKLECNYTMSSRHSTKPHTL